MSVILCICVKNTYTSVYAYCICILYYLMHSVCIVYASYTVHTYTHLSLHNIHICRDMLCRELTLPHKVGASV